MIINNTTAAGIKLSKAEKVLIMIHGRGGSAEDILSLSSHLNVKEFALLAPRAASHSWYPYSFLARPEENDPALSEALQLLKELVNEIVSFGITKEHIYFLGFSQGACLALEFVATQPAKYGGVVAFTGGLIGDRIYREKYTGDFQETTIFIGTSDPDPHVPVERVEESALILKEMNADVTLMIYSHMGHTISREEIDEVNQLIFH